MKKKIKVAQSGIHHRGVFAVEEIARDERIVPYTGRLLTKAQSEHSKSLYLFELNRKYDVIGLNIARYINHSCKPNCETEVKNGQIWIRSIKKILPGEELTYNYHYDLEESKDFPCRCGQPGCVGAILAPHHWRKLKKNRAASKKETAGKKK